MKELIIFIAAIIILWFAWFWFGGPERYDPNQGPLLKSPTGSQYNYDSTSENTEF